MGSHECPLPVAGRRVEGSKGLLDLRERRRLPAEASLESGGFGFLSREQRGTLYPFGFLSGERRGNLYPFGFVSQES